MSAPLLSLCIPTNGIVSLVFPVLESIYCQDDVDLTLFEVIVMDNGDNKAFKSQIKEFAKQHGNLVYRETASQGFLGEGECYRVASGTFVKFINHRTKLLPHAISYFIDFIRQNEAERPCVYFSNGVIKQIEGFAEYADFDSYVKNLHVWSSWSTGMGFWKDDFDRIPKDTDFNELFPHTTVLFAERNKSKYIIDNTHLLDEINVGHANKGRYNLFHAFAVEYPGIICDLLRDGSISAETFLSIKKDNFKFVAGLYLDFVVLKQKCSYDLSGCRQTLEVFFNYKNVKRKAFTLLCARVVKLPFKIVRLARKFVTMYCSVRKYVGGGYNNIVPSSAFLLVRRDAA